MLELVEFLRSKSVTRQVNFDKVDKIGGKGQN